MHGVKDDPGLAMAIKERAKLWMQGHWASKTEYFKLNFNFGISNKARGAVDGG